MAGLRSVAEINRCQERWHGPVQINLQPFGGNLGASYIGRAPTLEEAQFNLATGPQFFRDVAQKVLSGQPRELFPGAIALASVIASAGIGEVIPGYLVATLQTIKQVEEQKNMALNIGQLLSGIGGAIGGISGANVSAYTQPFGSLLQAGGTIASAFQPQTMPVVSTGLVPTYGGVPAMSSPQAIPVAAKPPVKSSTRGMTQEIFGAASKMLAAIGLTPTTVGGFFSATRRAITALAALARRTPAGTLVSLLLGLGLTALEANMLAGWWATEGKKRRRMNPANSKALRRAARRIKSFHRLCVHTDVLKSRGRRASARCATCKRSPCRC